MRFSFLLLLAAVRSFPQFPISKDFEEYSNKNLEILRGDVTGKGVTVFVIDQRIDHSHPDFEGRATNGVNFDPSRDINTGHGSMVAGVVGGKTVGVAPGSEIIGLNVFNYPEDASQRYHLLDAFHAIKVYKSERGHFPMVASVTSGWGGLLKAEELEICEEFPKKLYHLNVPVIVSAGNDGQEKSSYPSNSNWTITVGAADYQMSNYGESVFIFAPGENIFTVDPKSNGFIKTQGTSFSTPYIAGIVALYLEKNPSLSVDEIKTLLKNHSDPYYHNPGLFGYARSWLYGIEKSRISIKINPNKVAKYLRDD